MFEIYIPIVCKTIALYYFSIKYKLHKILMGNEKISCFAQKVPVYGPE
jgi:hypothetical protein